MKTFTILSVVLSIAGALALTPLADEPSGPSQGGPYGGVQGSRHHRGGSRHKIPNPTLEQFEAGYKAYKAHAMEMSSVELTPMQVWYGYYNQLVHPMYPSNGGQMSSYPVPTTSTEAPMPEMTMVPPPPTPAGSGRVIDVIVGKDDTLTYEPADILAKQGDIVRFHFVAKNHTVTQSSRNDPCNPLADMSGFDSGFQPIEAGSGAEKTFDVTVTQDKKPIWFYCQQFVPTKGLSHCQLGMVGAINADRNGQNSLNAFRTRASSSD